jgi:hypothetical protein
MSDIDDRLDKLASHRRRLADHEKALAAARAHLDEGRTADRISERTGAGLAGVMAALGLAVWTGTAQAAPPTVQGQVGTTDRPLETVCTAGLDGPLTDGQQVTSLVGDGLDITDGTLSISGGT